MKQRWKKLLLFVLIIYIGAMVVFFTHPTSSQKSDEKSILTVWGWDETIPDAFREYQLSHPQVSMNYVHVEKNEYLDKLKLSLALQQPLPDICILE